MGGRGYVNGTKRGSHYRHKSGCKRCTEKENNLTFKVVKFNGEDSIGIVQKDRRVCFIS